MENIFSRIFIRQEITDIGIFRKGKNIQKHLKSVHEKIIELSVPMHQRCNFLMKTLDEDILLELRACFEFQEKYELIVSLLKELYEEPTTTEISVGASLLCVKQKPGQKIKDYISEIRVESMRLWPNGDKEQREKLMLITFIEGLRNNRYATILKQLNPSTLQEAFEWLKNEKNEDDQLLLKVDESVETKLSQMEMKLNLALKRIQQLESKLMRVGMEENHRTWPNRNWPNQKQQQKACFHCKRGHIKQNCPLLRECAICHRRNHATKDCYFKRNEDKKLRNVENESVKSVTSSEIVEDGEQIFESDGEQMSNDAYLLCREDPKKRQVKKRQNTRIIVNSKYPKEVINWSNYIEGNGAQPKRPLSFTDARNKSCHTPTVISATCQEKAVNKPVIPAIVEGCVPKNIFLDSGCECNIVDYSFLKELSKTNNEIKILRSKAGNLSCANGSRMEVIGHTLLNVEVGSKRMRMKFAVVRSISPNILIGLRTMKQEKISIIPAWDCVKIDNFSVPFVSKTKLPSLN